MHGKGRKGEGTARSSLIGGGGKTITVAAWRLVESPTSHSIPKLNNHGSADQANNPPFLKVKKFYPTNYFQFEKCK